MSRAVRQKGFSLTEVLMAVGVLALGMVFVAGSFPVGMYFATVASEKTTAINVAEEAFSKIRMYGMNGFSDNSWTDWTQAAVSPKQYSVNYEYVVNSNHQPTGEDYFYPSTTTENAKQYSWTAICRPVSLNNVQVTVFVCRRVGANKKYYYRDGNPNNSLSVNGIRPAAVTIVVEQTGSDERELEITSGYEYFVDGGYSIVDDATGIIHKVTERDDEDTDIIRLDRDWVFDQGQKRRVWVVPAAVGGGRKPCVGVYQKIMRFN